MLSRPIDHMPHAGLARAGQLLVACGLFIGLVLAAAVVWYSAMSRQVVLDGAVREMRNDALLLADEEDRLLRSVDTVQLALIEHMRAGGIDSPELFERVMASREVHDNLAERIAGLPYITGLALANQYGVSFNFSRVWPPPPRATATRDFVREMTRDGAPPFFISEPIQSGISGKWIIHRTRRFDAADGRLIGFVVSTIEVEYFEHYYAQLPLTGGGAFSLYRRDGMLLARYPHIDPKVGKVFAKTMKFDLILDVTDKGALHQLSMLDGKDRLIVPRSLPHFPLLIAVSDTMDSILRPWLEQIRVLVSTTVLLELMIAGTILLGVRHLSANGRLLTAETARTRAEAGLALAGEREQAALTLNEHMRLFDTAVNNMHQGLCMYDRESRIVVANRRFCELFGLAENAITPGLSYPEATEMVVAAGVVTQADMDKLREQRNELVAARTLATFAWELTNGRTVMINHQPMEAGWLTTYEDITERRQAESRIEHLAHHDLLTGLPNRVLFRDLLERTLVFVRRGHLLALHCLNLDQFKAVNDTLGHPVGDGLLQAVAQRLQDSLRDTDTVARLGGDEFAIVQPAIESPLDATMLADRLIQLLAAPFEIGGHQIVIGTSIGIAFAPQDGVDADQLLKCADLALYRAKHDGRGVYRLFQADMDAAMQARRIMEVDLRRALPRGQLEVFYQAQIDVAHRCVAGCEALVRWRHPERGLIPPDQFIPLAEETGMIVAIGEWVLRQACATAAAWPDDLRIAVNLSAVQFKCHNLVAMVVAALRESGLPASRLELEITETVMLRDTDATLAVLHQLRDLGIQIAMDDFGTGYSSLGYLRRFPFDRIKIDQSFIRELGEKDDCIAIVRAVTTLGHDLGIAITAEGVETRQQADMLERAGCTELQGYLFSRPVPEAEVTGLSRSMPIIADVWPASGARALPVPVETRAKHAGARELLHAAGR
jgi:diguanylate cyclase (GGDEF)-like protein/PAS domain S-box-containing protein